MSREAPVRFWESVGVKIPHATQLRGKSEEKSARMGLGAQHLRRACRGVLRGVARNGAVPERKIEGDFSLWVGGACGKAGRRHFTHEDESERGGIRFPRFRCQNSHVCSRADTRRRHQVYLEATSAPISGNTPRGAASSRLMARGRAP